MMPYVMAFSAIWLSCPQVSWCAAPPSPLPDVAWPATFEEMVIFASKAWGAGLAELVFSRSPWIGLGVLMALALFDWRAAGLAALGAACGTLTAIGLGLPTSLISIGLYGFGSALTALALRRGTMRCGWLATVVAASATAVATAVLGSLGTALGNSATRGALCCRGMGMHARAASASIRGGRGDTSNANRDEAAPYAAQFLNTLDDQLFWKVSRIVVEEPRRTRSGT